MCMPHTGRHKRGHAEAKAGDDIGHVHKNTPVLIFAGCIVNLTEAAMLHSNEGPIDQRILNQISPSTQRTNSRGIATPRCWQTRLHLSSPLARTCDEEVIGEGRGQEEQIHHSGSLHRHRTVVADVDICHEE